MRINACRGERLGNAAKQALVCLFYECSFGMAGCLHTEVRSFGAKARVRRRPAAQLHGSTITMRAFLCHQRALNKVSRCIRCEFRSFLEYWEVMPHSATSSASGDDISSTAGRNSGV